MIPFAPGDTPWLASGAGAISHKPTSTGTSMGPP
jgi:hypothetical protein